MDVLIAGGGIGGLTAAIALARRGHAVRLVEKRASFEPVGAGIMLAANATRVLTGLGVALGAGRPFTRLALRLTPTAAVARQVEALVKPGVALVGGAAPTA
jgi:2-polyprenyl-6-methoxyphenol hydroxylase-like FAD-dependent oxidoreductase